MGGYRILQRYYLRILRVKALSAFSCFVLAFLTAMLRETVSPQTLHVMVLSTIAFSTWQIFTLPTGRFGDRAGNSVDMHTGIFYHKQYGALCTLVN